MHATYPFRFGEVHSDKAVVVCFVISLNDELVFHSGDVLWSRERIRGTRKRGDGRERSGRRMSRGRRGRKGKGERGRGRGRGRGKGEGWKGKGERGRGKGKGKGKGER